MAAVRAHSTGGLRLLDAQTRVVLTGTPYHQDVLLGYAPPAGGPPRQVAVELVPAPLWSGEQSEWWGLEARIDGYRVGELTHPTAGWYWPLVDEALRRGQRTGAESHVVLDEFGYLAVELYLPVAGAAAVDAADEPDSGATRPVPLWMGVAAAALGVLMVGSVAADRLGRDDPITASPTAEASTRLSLAAESPAAPSPPPAEPFVTEPADAEPVAPPPVAAPRTPRTKITVPRQPVVVVRPTPPVIAVARPVPPTLPPSLPPSLPPPSVAPPSEPPASDPPVDTEPPSDPPSEPPSDPPTETDPPEESEPPSDPPEETDPPEESDPPSDPPGDSDPPEESDPPSESPGGSDPSDESDSADSDRSVAEPSDPVD